MRGNGKTGRLVDEIDLAFVSDADCRLAEMRCVTGTGQGNERRLKGD